MNLHGFGCCLIFSLNSRAGDAPQLPRPSVQLYVVYVFFCGGGGEGAAGGFSGRFGPLYDLYCKPFIKLNARERERAQPPRLETEKQV